MAIKAAFGKAFQSQLGHFPVWDVGSSVAVGDYGEVNEHCFTKLGSLVEDYEVTIKLQSAPPASFWEFTSEGTAVTETGLDLSAPDAVEAKIELTFRSAHSLCVRANRSRVVSMANAVEIGRQLRNSPRGWKGNRVFVSSVRVAEGFSLFMNTSNNSSITLSAAAPILASVMVGRAEAGASLRVSGDAGLKALGVSGALYTDLMKLPLFGEAPRLRGKTEKAVEAVELDFETT